MATIYRFIVEQKTQASSSGRKTTDKATKGAAKKGRSLSFFGGDKGGVEHNRKMRAINPLLNRATGGAWEKGMRLTRAGIGLVKNAQEEGAKGIFSGPAIYIIIAFCIQAILKWQQNEIKKANKQNAQNFKMLENGVDAVRGEYEISVNLWNGRRTYNQNK